MNRTKAKDLKEVDRIVLFPLLQLLSFHQIQLMIPLYMSALVLLRGGRMILVANFVDGV